MEVVSKVGIEVEDFCRYIERKVQHLVEFFYSEPILSVFIVEDYLLRPLFGYLLLAFVCYGL